MLRQIEQNLWVCDSPFKYLGLEVGTRMTIIRLQSGKVVVISPTQVDSQTIEQINQIGEVKFIIAPNLYHHLFLSEFTEIYPQAKLWVAPGLEIKRIDLPIAQVFQENEASIEDEIEYFLFKGLNVFNPSTISPLNEVVFFHRDSKTLILTDTAFYFDETYSFSTQLVTRVLQSYKKLRPSLLEKFAHPDREQIKKSMQKILKWDFKRVIIAHGKIIEENAKNQLKQGYEWFLGIKL